VSTEDHPDWWNPVGGANSQDSTLERRSTIWNDGDPTPGDAPPISLTGADYYGKFFTRGCRGMISSIQIYCIRTAAGNLDLSFSPHPCLGPLYTVTVTPGAAWAWAAANFRQMWNYDSLFIWVSRCDVDVSWGYDQDTPPDGHRSPDGGATWIHRIDRMYIRVYSRGETPGDVPVSGIINNVPIPNMSSHHVEDNVDVPMGVLTLISEVEGAGYVDLVIMAVIQTASSQVTGFQFHADGVLCWEWSPFDMSNWGMNDDTQPMSLLVYAEDDWCVIMCTKKWEFRRHFEIYALNNFAPVRVYTRMYPNMMR